MQQVLDFALITERYLRESPIIAVHGGMSSSHLGASVGRGGRDKSAQVPWAREELTTYPVEEQEVGRPEGPSLLVLVTLNP